MGPSNTLPADGKARAPLSWAIEERTGLDLTLSLYFMHACIQIKMDDHDFILYCIKFRSKVMCFHCTGRVAQWIARQTSDLKVGGSSPPMID
jgi:hypothetical protein